MQIPQLLLTYYYAPMENSSVSLDLHALVRGVQYVHWVMHKCIMVKVGGKRKNTESTYKTPQFYEIRGEICNSRES